MTKELINTNLELQLSKTCLPIATSFVETSAVASGLPKRDALALTLATEEVFAYLCSINPTGQVQLGCESHGYFFQLEFRFAAVDFSLRSFNITSTVSVDDEASLDEMGLLIASRSVSEFRVELDPEGNEMILVLTKNKTYDQTPEKLEYVIEPTEEFSLRRPEPAEVALAAQLLPAYFGPYDYPERFASPGELVDRVEVGDLSATVAVSKQEQICGIMLWEGTEARNVECFGPYLFNQSSPAMAQGLLESCLTAIGRSLSTSLLNRWLLPEECRSYFEPLGHFISIDRQGKARDVTGWFRQLHEDPGTTVWAHVEIKDFLESEYRRLFLPRLVSPVQHFGEKRKDHSVIKTDIRRDQDLVLLRPVQMGADLEANLQDHLDLFRKENVLNVVFEIDLAKAWQSQFVPALLGAGFKPVLVLPYAGEKDFLLFNLSADA